MVFYSIMEDSDDNIIRLYILCLSNSEKSRYCTFYMLYIGSTISSFLFFMSTTRYVICYAYLLFVTFCKIFTFFMLKNILQKGIIGFCKFWSSIFWFIHR